MPPDALDPISFAKHIKTMFLERNRRSMLFALRAIALVVGGIALAACLAGCASTQHAEPPRVPACTDVLFLGVRGSGESRASDLAMGSTVYSTLHAMQQTNPQIVGYGYAYPQQRPDAAAVIADSIGLDRLITQRLAQCPDEHLLLSGYSDGAQIVADAIQDPQLPASDLGRLQAIALFADPEFDPADAAAAAGTFNPAFTGQPIRRPYAAPVNGHIRSYCRSHDVVCQRQDPSADKNEHGRYAPIQTCQAALFLERNLGLDLSRC